MTSCISVATSCVHFHQRPRANTADLDQIRLYWNIIKDYYENPHLITIYYIRGRSSRTNKKNNRYKIQYTSASHNRYHFVTTGALAYSRC